MVSVRIRVEGERQGNEGRCTPPHQLVPNDVSQETWAKRLSGNCPFLTLHTSISQHQSGVRHAGTIGHILGRAEENTELYYRALRAIRSAPPPVPVDIREALGLEIKKEKLPS